MEEAPPQGGTVDVVDRPCVTMYLYIYIYRYLKLYLYVYTYMHMYVYKYIDTMLQIFPSSLV